jgi:hypothetical protein
VQPLDLALLGEGVGPSRPRELLGERLLDDHIVQAKITVPWCLLQKAIKSPISVRVERSITLRSRFNASWARLGKKSATRVCVWRPSRRTKPLTYSAIKATVVGLPTTALTTRRSTMRATWAARGRVVRYSRDVMEKPPPGTVGLGNLHRIRL